MYRMEILRAKDLAWQRAVGRDLPTEGAGEQAGAGEQVLE